MNKEQPKIFISYSWEDKAISRKLADCLRRDGAQVWIDYSENKAGDSFIKKMNSGLEWCDIFVLLWSKSAANSNFVSMEWGGALANNLKIIPCLIDKTKLPFILSGRIYKDFSDFDEGYNSLAKDLNLVLKEEKPKKIKKLNETNEKPTISNLEIISVFRNSPQELSRNDVKNILLKYDFFDSNKNENGRGFDASFKNQNIKGENVVIEKNSGLMWQQSGSSKEFLFEDTGKWIIEINKMKLAGSDDWRLPTLEEAMSLMKSKKTNNNKYIDPIFDSIQGLIWTADKMKNANRQWIVSFNYGHCISTPYTDDLYVRAVRSL